MARPSKLTPETHRVVVEAIRAAVTRKAAGRIAGITDRTIRNWMETGEAVQHSIDAGEEVTPEEEVFAEFYNAVEKAEAEVEQGLSASVLRAALGDNKHRIKPDWRAAVAYLERRHPDWKPKSHNTIDGDIGDASPARAASLVREEFGQHGAMNEADTGGTEEGSEVPSASSED